MGQYSVVTLTDNMTDGEKLCDAAGKGDLSLVNTLLAEGVDINYKGPGLSSTPLMRAMCGKQPAIVARLLSKPKTKLDVRVYGWNCLHWGADVECVKMVLRDNRCPRGFLNMKNRSGYSPLMWAVKCGHLATVSYLLTVDGVDLHTTDNKGNTLIEWARVENHGEIEQLLLRAGAPEVSAS